MPITDMGVDISPKTVILELIYYDSIYDEFLAGMEELIEKEITLHSTEILEEIDKHAYDDPWYCPTEISKYRNYQDDDGWATRFVHEELPSLIRGSALVTLFSIFENNIKHICDNFFYFTPLKIKYDDITGRSALDKLKTTIEILGNKILDDGREFLINENLFKQSEYQIIKKTQIIRNCFAHANGRIKEKDRKKIFQNKYIKDHFRINEDRVIIKAGALIFVSKNMRNLYTNILTNMK